MLMRVPHWKKRMKHNVQNHAFFEKYMKKAWQHQFDTENLVSGGMGATDLT